MEKFSFSNLNKDEKYIFICCLFVFAVNGLYSIMLGSLLPLISSEYGLNNIASGALLSGHQTGNLVASFLAGMLPIYLGKKKSILFLSFFAVLGFAGVIIFKNPIILIAAFIFTGISRGSISNFNNTTVNELSGGSAIATSLLHSIFAIGALIGPFLIIACTDIFGDGGWRMAVAAVILLILISIMLFSRMKIDEKVIKKEKKKISYAFLKHKSFWICIGMFFFYLCAESAINGWIVKYFVDSAIMSREYAQVLASVLWVVILAGRLTCTFLAGRVLVKHILLVSSVFMALFYILLLATTNIYIITLAIIGVGYSMAGIYPAIISTASPVMKKYPMALGVLLTTGGIGAILMPIITGALADKSGIFAGMSAIVVAIVIMVAFIIINSIGKNSAAEQ